MRKETVVRQNRCDHEMNLLLYLCYFLYLTIWLFLGRDQISAKMHYIEKALYLVFVPGFIFRLGYCFRQIFYAKSEERGKQLILWQAVRYYVYFFLLAMGNQVIQYFLPVNDSLVKVLTAVVIPPVSAVFFTMAVVMMLVWVFYQQLGILSKDQKKMMVVGIICLLAALLCIQDESYAVVAALTGSRVQQTVVPGIPYFVYFLLGMWLEEKKPGFDVKIAGISLVVSAVSAVLMRTPLENLARITVSMVAVYAIYVMAEYMSDQTLRFRTFRFVCMSIEPVFVVYAMILHVVYIFTNGFVGIGSKRTFLLYGITLVLIYVGMMAYTIGLKCYQKAAQSLVRARHKMAIYFLCYTAAFVVFMLLTFLPFFMKHKTLLWTADTVSQYYPRAVYFAGYIREVLKGILHGNFNFPVYDFRMGLGSEITYSMEPLYFLIAVFGKNHVEFAYQFLIVLRFYLAGITASIFCFYFKKDYIPTFIASALYVFCGFSLYGGARHPMFMIPMIMLPLLIIGIEEIIRGNRWYLNTIFVAVALLSNYYFLYMCTIGMGIYFVVRFFCQENKEARKFIKFIQKGLVISGSYLLGVAMSCITLVTTFGIYMGSGRSSAAVIKTPSLFFYNEQWLARCFVYFIMTAESPGEWLKLGFLPISFFAVIILFTRKGRKELKVLSVISVILMMFPLFAFIFSGFDSIVNRWCFLVALLVAYIVADCLYDLLHMTRREMLICGVFTGIYGFLTFFGTVLTIRYAKAAFFVLCLTLVVILLCQEQVKRIGEVAKQYMIIVLTFALVFQGGFSFFYMAGAVGEYSAPGAAKRKSEDTPMAAVAEMYDDSFYRVGTPKLDYSTISSSITLDYNSIYMFYSTLNGSMMNFMEHLGVANYSATQMMGFGNRAFLNAMAAIKYYAYYDEELNRTLPYGYEEVRHTTANDKAVTICENRNALPIGYTYDTVISKEDLEAYGVLERAEVMMQHVMLESAGDAAKPKTEITAKKLDTVVSASDKMELTPNSLRAESKKGKVTISFQSEPNAETYLVLKNAVIEGDMTEQSIGLTLDTDHNSTNYKFRASDDRYAPGQTDYVFNLGYHENAIDQVTIKFNRAGEIKFDSYEVYSQSMENLERYSDERKADILEDVTFTANTVAGHISLEEDKVLVMSIPYQNGWTAVVDGEKVPVERANYMYLGVRLPKGEHEVSFTYEIPGMKYALIIMPSAATIYLILCLAAWIKARRKRKAAQK